MYHHIFALENKLTLDRINNFRLHIKEYIKFCCLYFNQYKFNTDKNTPRLNIQLRIFTLFHSLKFVILSKLELACHVIHNDIIGGISNVHHKFNITGE